MNYWVKRRNERNELNLIVDYFKKYSFPDLKSASIMNFESGNHVLIMLENRNSFMLFKRANRWFAQIFVNGCIDMKLLKSNDLQKFKFFEELIQLYILCCK